MKKYFTIFVGIIFLTSFLNAGEIENAVRLRGMAHAQWGQAELQGKGLTKAVLSKEELVDRVRQAVIWLEAAERLSDNDKYVLADLEYLYRSEMIDDPGRAMKTLVRYSDIVPEDNLCVSGWMDYTLAMLNKQDARSSYINSMLENLMAYPKVQSDMIKLLGIYALEQGDADRAAGMFEYAWKVWPYNIDSAARLLALPLPEVDDKDGKLSEQEKASINIQLQQNRVFHSFYYMLMVLASDPGKADISLNLADILFSMNKYDSAWVFYDHCLKLLAMKNDDSVKVTDLAGIEFKAAVSCFNAGKYDMAANFLDGVQAKIPGDIASAAFEYLVLQKKGMTAEAAAYANEFESSAAQREQNNIDMVWYYIFAKNDLAKAQEYAEKIETEASASLPGVVGYLQAVSGQVDGIDDFISKYPPNSAINCFAIARAYANSGDFDKAYQYITQARDSSPGALNSFIESARAELVQQVGITEPEPMLDSIDMVLNRLDISALAIAFKPEEYLQCGARCSRKMFEYTEDIPIDISVSNISDTELVMGSDMFFDPYLYVVAEVVRDVPGKEPERTVFPVGLRYLAQRPTLRPGFSNSFQDIVNYGELGRLIEGCPQIDCKVKFTCLPMPYISEVGKVESLFPELVSSEPVVTRQAFVLTPQRLLLNYKMLMTGRSDEKVRAVKLFTGLLKEGMAARAGELSYSPKQIDHDKTVSAVLAVLADKDPLVRAWTAYYLDGLVSDKAVVNALSDRLKDENWFVRLMALNTLKANVKIDSVLEWFSKNETDETVLRQVQLWLGKKWQTEELEFDFPEPVEAEAGN